MSSRTRATLPLRSGIIRAWLQYGARPSDGAAIGSAMAWARRQWECLGVKPSMPAAITGDSPYADRLHALVSIARADYSADPAHLLHWYQAVKAITWLDDLLGEKAQIMCSLAYCLSRQYRRRHDPASSFAWQKEAVTLALQQAAVPEFLNLPSMKSSEELREAFLSDPPVLLAFCDRQLDLGIQEPCDSLNLARGAYAFVSESTLERFQAEERAWFLAYLETLIAIGEKYRGDYAESARWLVRASETCRRVEGTELSMALIEFVGRALTHEAGHSLEAIEGLSGLTSRFQSYGVQRGVARCLFLAGTALKALNHHAEALIYLKELSSLEHSDVAPWLRGLALVEAAEVLANMGEDGPALNTLAKAWHLVKDSGVAGAVGHFHGVKGQILRDHGLFDEAAYSYRQAGAWYAEAGAKSFESLLHVILAETLLASGRNKEAAEEVAAVLPLIETLGLVREGVVAVGLLRESLRRQEANTEALRTLRREIQSLGRRSS